MDSPRKRIAWIGAGVMGLHMAGHLMTAGHQVVVFSRTKGKAQPLIDRGAEWADSSADAAEGADVAMSMVGYPADVEEVHLGLSGTLAATKPPGLIIDMTTSRPELAVRIARAAGARGIDSVDAPVSGGDVGARNATLAIMAGGDSEAFEVALPLLAIVGKSIVHQGPPGAGQHTKMVNQILIATNMIGVCEGLMYASKAGLDPLKVIQSVGSGAAGSWSINNLGPRIINGDFSPGFFVEHFIKDLGIALEESRRMGLNMPGLSLAKRLYDEVALHGHGRLGTQSLFLTLKKLSNA
jgi:3-hydroxyisobutyrate dehydrogenase